MQLTAGSSNKATRSTGPCATQISPTKMLEELVDNGSLDWAFAADADANSPDQITAVLTAPISEGKAGTCKTPKRSCCRKELIRAT